MFKPRISIFASLQASPVDHPNCISALAKSPFIPLLKKGGNSYTRSLTPRSHSIHPSLQRGTRGDLLDRFSDRPARTKSLLQSRLDEPALVQLSHQPAIGELLRFCPFGPGILFFQALKQTGNAWNGRIGRQGEIGLDGRIVTLLENFLVIGPEIFAHDL